MKFANRAILASLIASSLPEYQLVSARKLAELSSRTLSADTCSQLVDASENSGHLLSLTLTRGGNDATTVQDSSSTYHEHGSFAATAEWYSDVCGDYSLSCTHHECSLGLYFVPCKKNDDYETTDGGGNAFSINGFTSLQLQGTTELAFQGATPSLLECTVNCDNFLNKNGGSAIGLDTEMMEGEFLIENFDNKVETVSTGKKPKSSKNGRRAQETFEPSWDDGKPSHRNLQVPIFKLKHGMGFFSVVGGTGCYSGISGGQAQGRFGIDGGTMNIFVPYLRGFSSSIISEGLQDSAFAAVDQPDQYSSSSSIPVPGVSATTPKTPPIPSIGAGGTNKEAKPATKPITTPVNANSLSAIDWDVSVMSGIRNPTTHGWVVDKNGLDLTFQVEDSYICPGGDNSAEQKGKATATINLSRATSLMYTISGRGEQLDTGFELMTFKIDGVVVATATSTAAGKECASGPLTINYKVAPPYNLSAGPHKLSVSFTTADGFDHVDSFYKLELSTQ